MVKVIQKKLDAILESNERGLGTNYLRNGHVMSIVIWKRVVHRSLYITVFPFLWKSSAFLWKYSSVTVDNLDMASQGRQPEENKDDSKEAIRGELFPDEGQAQLSDFIKNAEKVAEALKLFVATLESSLELEHKPKKTKYG